MGSTLRCAASSPGWSMVVVAVTRGCGHGHARGSDNWPAQAAATVAAYPEAKLLPREPAAD
jgi:hypothetical protein